MKKIFILVIILVSSLISIAQTINDSLFLAVDSSDVIAVKNFISKGADVNAKTEDAVTPLMFAANNGNNQIVQLLIDKGADVNAIPVNKITALMSAAMNNHFETVEMLVKAGANLELTSNNGNTALLYSVAYSYLEIADMLLFYDANVNHTNNKTSALHVASYNGDWLMDSVLISHKARIDDKDMFGYTPLMLSCQNGHIQVAKLLIENGANIEEKNNEGLNSLGIASYFGLDSVVDFLLKNKANKTPKIYKNLDLLSLAKMNGMKSTMNLLKSSGCTSNLSPYLDQFAFLSTNNLNFHDYSIGIELEWHELKTGTNMQIGISTRPFRKKVLWEVQDDLYYQMREWRTSFYLALNKEFAFYQNTYTQKGFYVGSKFAFYAANSKGSNRYIQESKFVPQLGYFYKDNGFYCKIGYEYVDYKTYKISPHRIIFSFGGYFAHGRFSPSRHTLYWMGF